MGKRSNFTRRPKDKYHTFDRRAAAALAPHVPWGVKYWEPCAAAGDLVDILSPFGFQCMAATDIAPESEGVYRLDALTVTASDVASTGATHIITNPVWSRPVLHQMIMQFSDILPTWLLFDADWIHTKQSAKHLSRCRKVVSVGKLRWIKGTPHDSKDNCAWYLFDAKQSGPIEFVGRGAA